MIEVLNALISLKDKIDSKSPFDEAEKIVDYKLTPIGSDSISELSGVEHGVGEE